MSAAFYPLHTAVDDGAKNEFENLANGAEKFFQLE
jgi:hypothetical protein